MASAGTDGQVTRGSTALTRILIALTVIGVLAGAAGLLLPLVAGDGRADEDTRKEIVAVVTDFVAAYNTYDSADVAEYQQRVRPLLTESFHEQFVEITDAAFPLLQSKKIVSGDVNLMAAGVKGIDADEATALVAFDTEIRNDTDAAAVQQSFRWTLTLRKIDGRWLVDNVQNVPQAGASVATPEPTDDAEEGQE